MDIENEVARAVENEGDLMDMAYVMEAESAERYAELADQMQIHNNHDVAELFVKLAAIEGKQAEKVAGGEGVAARPGRKPWDYKWLDPVSPEVTGSDEVHYLMTPHHALKMALINEERAVDFYDAVARLTASEEVRAAASELAAEEREHVELVQKLLNDYPEPDAGWDDDPDPTNAPA
ncbi:MAG: ferritin family protein [Rhodospirillales bacterium]|jgi:hypothetical protein|nr:ferritin family protein [Rhodospirillales bacterium]|tara:strand:+ start:358 stop:891 length:534 start_codon:yes stop_codon:yes gene_type:complete